MDKNFIVIFAFCCGGLFTVFFGMWLKDSGSAKKDKSSVATRQDIVAIVGAQTVGNALLAAILAALLVH
jgi:hypothetical protein